VHFIIVTRLLEGGWKNIPSFAYENPTEHARPSWYQLLRNEEQFLFPIVEHVSVCNPTAIHHLSTVIFFIFANKKIFGKTVE
jgi:hypothetical protein